MDRTHSNGETLLLPYAPLRLDFRRSLGSSLEEKGRDKMPIIDLSRGGGEGMGVGEARAHFPKQPLVIEPVRHSVSKGLMMISASVSVNFFRVVFLYRNSLFVLLTSWSSSDQSKLRLDNFLRQKNTKWVTINQNETMMVDIWED